MPVIYLLARQLRAFVAWTGRSEGPRERTGVIVTISIVFGFVVGSMAQPFWDKSGECHEQGRPLLTCIFFSGQEKN